MPAKVKNIAELFKAETHTANEVLNIDIKTVYAGMKKEPNFIKLVKLFQERYNYSEFQCGYLLAFLRLVTSIINNAVMMETFKKYSVDLPVDYKKGCA